MDTTDNLLLPYIMPSQAQKHVTHNEALGMLDALAQLAVLDRDLTAPPASPANGACYIVAAGSTGDWAGRTGQVAHRLDGAWNFYPPKPGFLAYVIDEARFIVWTGSAWTDFDAAIHALQDLAVLGLGTSADATNPFAAKLNKALWTARTTAEGGDGDLRLTLNKEAASDIVSILMQSGYSGRAELGLVGTDDCTLKVSADGSAWMTALTIDRATGALTLAACTIATLPSAAPAGRILHCTDLGGGAGLIQSDGMRWRRLDAGGIQAVTTDAGFTLTTLANAQDQRHTGTLTASRTITLSSTNAYAGARFRVTRTGSGAFTLSLGGLKALATNDWAEAIYDGSAWVLAAAGTL